MLNVIKKKQLLANSGNDETPSACLRLGGDTDRPYRSPLLDDTIDTGSVLFPLLWTAGVCLIWGYLWGYSSGATDGIEAGVEAGVDGGFAEHGEKSLKAISAIAALAMAEIAFSDFSPCSSTTSAAVLKTDAKPTSTPASTPASMPAVAPPL